MSNLFQEMSNPLGRYWHGSESPEPEIRFWENALDSSCATGNFDYVFWMSEDEVVESYLALDAETRQKVLALADQNADGQCCELSDPSKRKYRHHLSRAVTLLLALPAFKHFDGKLSRATLRALDGRRIYSKQEAKKPGFKQVYRMRLKQRDFRSLFDVALVLIQHEGLYCHGCEKVHLFDQHELPELLSDRPVVGDDDDESPLRWPWQLGVCKDCFLMATGGRRTTTRGEEDAVAAWVSLDTFQRKQAQLERRIYPTAPPLSAYPPPPRVEYRYVKVYVRDRMLGKHTRKWKAAYDAVKELGIDVEEDRG